MRAFLKGFAVILAVPLVAFTAGELHAAAKKTVPATTNSGKDAAAIRTALAAIDARDYDKAMVIITPLANAGNNEAQYLRGLLNEAGVIPHASDVNAMAWYVKAAAAGNAKAQNNLGAMYYDGRGVPQDLVQARNWYGRAAQQGNPQAQLNYALMLGQGLGAKEGARTGATPLDPAGMLYWLQGAAAQGYARAQLQLGKVYLSGVASAPDTLQAAHWFRLAAEQDSTEAQFLLGELLQKGEGVRRDLDTAVIWFERAAVAEPSDAMAAANYELGVIYELGLGTVADSVKSAAYYRRAAYAGYAKAIAKLKADQ